VTLWQRLKSRFGGAGAKAGADDATPAASTATPAAPAPAVAVAAAEPDVLAPLLMSSAPTELELREALAALRRARGTSLEARAIGLVLERDEALDDALRVEVAAILALRGDEARALEIVSGARSAPALMLLADLAADAGDLPRALGAVERVLARDIETPGALERHERWARALGASPMGPRKNDEATMLAPSPAGVPFRIEDEIARGGAGAVYRATDEILGRTVAFKAYHAGAADRAAILREVRVASRLAGPGVVRVLDVGLEAGWVALEWTELGSLRELLRRGDTGRVPPLGAWLVPLARALARVHAAGWVHSDVKPGNVLFRSASDPVLTDFGISRVAGAPGGGGSAGFVSPERLAGGAASPADDVYGFGRIVEDVLSHGAGSSPELDRLVTRCLGPLERRPPDGAALVEALGAWAQRRP
jgi:serine/threonine-protein kinase